MSSSLLLNQSLKTTTTVGVMTATGTAMIDIAATMVIVAATGTGIGNVEGIIQKAILAMTSGGNIEMKTIAATIDATGIAATTIANTGTTTNASVATTTTNATDDTPTETINIMKTSGVGTVIGTEIESTEATVIVANTTTSYTRSTGPLRVKDKNLSTTMMNTSRAMDMAQVDTQRMSTVMEGRMIKEGMAQAKATPSPKIPLAVFTGE